MTTLVHTLVCLAVIWVLAYHRARMYTILGSVLAALLVLTWMDGVSPLPWLALLAVGFFYVAPGLRRQWLTLPVFRFFQRVLPPMSATEQEALQAGGVWWEAELFKGDPDWSTLLGYPRPQLSAEEQRFLDQETETLCAMLDDWRIVHEDRDLPPEVWKYIKDKGFLGMIIPKTFGGLGFSALAHSTVVTKLATRSASAAVTVMVPNSLGPAELLLKYGTDAQRQRWLPGLARGEEVPCFALTSPEAGSDAGSLIDRGIVCRGTHEGQECLGIRLTWNKRYITLAPVATVLGLAFKLYDPEQLLGTNEELGITVALIPTNHPGVEIGNRHNPMRMAFMNGPTHGTDVFIPLDWIIGGVDYAGRGWQMLVECLSEGRAISLPALSTAIGKLCYLTTGAYASLRTQFNSPIALFEGVEEALARIAGRTYLLESARLLTAGAVDLHARPSVVSAIAKYHMTELSRDVIRDAMDIHGGRGLIMGPANYLAHGYMSTPIAITVEGANILTRNLIIFGQGAIRCHPFIFREMQAAKDPDDLQGLKTFDGLIFRHIGYGISNVVRTLSLSLTGARFVRKPFNDDASGYFQQLTRLSSSLALVADIAMLLLGGALKRKERLSARLGDVLSQLYLGSAVLKYYADQGRHADDLPYVHWNLQQALYLGQQALVHCLENLPNRPVAWILRWVVFPFGLPYQPPTDALDHAVVQTMLKPGPLRDRITAHTFVGSTETDPVWRVESAFRQVHASRELRQALRRAVREGQLPETTDAMALADAAAAAGLGDSASLDAYRAAERARRDAIQVDDFPP